MPLLCALGLHRWTIRKTARPGTTVYRCRTCNALVVTHNGAKRFRKRWWASGIVLGCLLTWYVVVALSLTGHTRLLWGAKKVVSTANKNGSRLRRAVHRAEGDHGVGIDNNMGAEKER